MISLPLMKQTVKSNGILWLIFTAVLGVLLAQYASLEMTQFLLFLIQYGMMAMILPGIYILISSNKLLVGQVDRGSMAYVLSTPKRRSTVVATQVLYSVVTIALMFVITTVLHGIINAASPLTLGQAGIEIPELMGAELTLDMILKVNLSAMLVCLAMGGVCFMFSGVFNQLEVFESNFPSVCKYRYSSSVRSSIPISFAKFSALFFGLFSFRFSIITSERLSCFYNIL